MPKINNFNLPSAPNPDDPRTEYWQLLEGRWIQMERFDAARKKIILTKRTRRVRKPASERIVET